MMKRLIPFLLAVILLSGCASAQVTDGATYTQIDQKTAMQMMEDDDSLIILDVRRQDEYDAGHIPGAILIPNESITTDCPKELPDLDQTILIYCRSGNRSKQAAQKLFDMGYKNIYEFGGINTWPGEVVTGDDETIPTLMIKANDNDFYATLEDNSSADALVEKLGLDPIEVDMHDYGNFEKVGDLPWELPRNDEQITTEPGDIILYQGNKITIYYDQNTWDFTRLAKIGDVSREELLDAFGNGNVTVEFSVEWSE